MKDGIVPRLLMLGPPGTGELEDTLPSRSHSTANYYP